jgi:hypothetical protein
MAYLTSIRVYIFVWPFSLVDSTLASVKTFFKCMNFGMLFISPIIFRRTEFQNYEVSVGTEVAPPPAPPFTFVLNRVIFLTHPLF